jgi:hypothetical protein
MRSSTSKLSEPLGLAQRHDGLHLQVQALQLVRRGQLAGQLYLGLMLLQRTRVMLKHHQVAAAALLGLAAGTVGGGDRILGRAARRRLDQTHGAAHMKRPVTHPIGLGQSGQRCPGTGQCLRQAQAGHEDDEFVAPHAPHVHAGCSSAVTRVQTWRSTSSPA